MPAKREHLTTRGQRALKITAGLIGGYFLSLALHMALAAALPFQPEVLLTATFTLFILWVAFMLLAFAAENGWKIWGIYLVSITLLSLFTYLLH